MPKPSAENPELPGYMPKSDPRRCCVSCRKPMAPQPELLATQVADEGTRPDGTKWRGYHTEYTILRIIGYGYRSENIFCSLRCGFSYGRRKYLDEQARLKRESERASGYLP